MQLRLNVLFYVEMVMPASWNAAASSNYWYRCPHAIAMTLSYLRATSGIAAVPIGCPVPCAWWFRPHHTSCSFRTETCYHVGISYPSQSRPSFLPLLLLLRTSCFPFNRHPPHLHILLHLRRRHPRAISRRTQILYRIRQRSHMPPQPP